MKVNIQRVLEIAFFIVVLVATSFLPVDLTKNTVQAQATGTLGPFNGMKLTFSIIGVDLTLDEKEMSKVTYAPWALIYKGTYQPNANEVTFSGTISVDSGHAGSIEVTFGPVPDQVKNSQEASTKITMKEACPDYLV